MTTLYVAGPMSHLPKYNYPAFTNAATRLGLLGYDTLNPVDAEGHNPTPGVPQEWDWYMRHALRMVLKADGVAVLPGWECSRGARLEVDVAHALRLPVLPVDAWIAKGGDPS